MCGHVGCGRYTGCGSGVHHNERTGHNFAMELATQRVWDYKGDNYVHRLLQNKVDGKLVELPDPGHGHAGAGSSGGGGDGREAMDPAAQEVKQRGLEEQYEAVVNEYSLLLTGQLEVQRRHYEDCLEELERKHKRGLWEAEQELGAREERMIKEHEILIKESRKESRALAKQVAVTEKATTDLDFNKQLNEQLMRNQAALRERLEASERREAEQAAKVTDMEEQLRDMTFHFESQIKILQEGMAGGLASEISGGSVVAPEAPPTARGKRKAKKGSG